MVPRALDLSAVVQNPFQAVAHMTPQSQVYDVHDSDDEVSHISLLPHLSIQLIIFRFSNSYFFRRAGFQM